MQTGENRAGTVVVGVCGGIAAYKTVALVSRLRQAGHAAHVAMTAAAERFVTPLTFAGVSGNRVWTRVFPDPEREGGDDLYPHLYPATQADALVVMPATANTLERLARGCGDDPVTLCALSVPPTCRRIICPAMNVEMWAQPVVQEQVRLLESRGWVRLGPDSGSLACGMQGAGRMVEPETVLAHLVDYWEQRTSLAGKQILIVSGPTREYLDPVRYLSNGSSGRMGQLLAETAADRGATVHFITGPVGDALLPRRSGITIKPVTSAQEMNEAAQTAFARADVTICVAAVADYRPRTYQATKDAKPLEPWALELEPTPDIAAGLGVRKRAGQQLIGFALQTGDGRVEAQEKLRRKRLDAIVLNHPEALGTEGGTYSWITTAGEDRWGSCTKMASAARIWDAVTNNPLCPGTSTK